MASSDDDGFAYDSEEGYVGPSDDDDWPDQVVARTKTPPAPPVSPFPPGPVGDVFRIDELLDKVLSYLDCADLASVSLVARDFRAHAQPWSAVGIDSFSRCHQVLALRHGRTAFRHARIALWDRTDALMSVPIIREQVAALEAGDPDLDMQYTWARSSRDDQKIVARPRWLREWEAHQHLWSLDARTDEQVHQSKLPFLLDAALRTLDPQTLEAIEQALRDPLSEWPFSPTPPASLSFRPALEQLLSSLHSLTLTFPLSHFAANLFASTSPCILKSLVVRAAPRDDTLLLIRDIEARAPKPVLALREDRLGLVGLPMLTSLDLDMVNLVLPERGGNERVPQRLTELKLTKVNVLSGRERGEVVRPQFRESVRDPWAIGYSRVSTLPPVDLVLSFDILRFCGAETARLTRLHLSELCGVVPSTVYALIRQSAPSLQHLFLNYLNKSFSSHEPYGPSWGSTFSTRENSQRHRTIIRLPNLPLTTQLFPAYPVDSTQDWPTDTVVGALRQCTALRTLYLDGYSADSHISPYPADVVDSLLTANPPMEELCWTVGLMGQPAPFALTGQWGDFASKVGQLRRRKEGKWMKFEVFLNYGFL
ncbi:hypothetical protein JCM8547_009319 [Rhodosporidiobolus lusitaniae]